MQQVQLEREDSSSKKLDDIHKSGKHKLNYSNHKFKHHDIDSK